MDSKYIIGILITGMIAILKGKDFWEFMKELIKNLFGRNKELIEYLKAEAKEKDKTIEHLRKIIERHVTKSKKK